MVYLYIAYTLWVNGVTMPIESAAVAGMTQRKTTQYYMRMDPEVKEAAERAASDDRRSLASLIDKLLTDYCLEHGYLKPKRGKPHGGW
jgi:hypothetical protein